MATRVLLADDHTIVRQGLRLLLQREGFEVVGEAANGAEAVRLATETTPDVVVLDYGMPLMNGLTAAREIMAVCPRAQADLVDDALGRSVRARGRAPGRQGLRRQEPGADGSGAGDPRSAQRHDVPEPARLADGGPGVPREVRAAPDPLTPREREVLQLVAAGKTTKEVAELLGISVKTAESHRTHIMQKLDTSNTAGVVRYAIRQGLIQV